VAPLHGFAAHTNANISSTGIHAPIPLVAPALIEEAPSTAISPTSNASVQQTRKRKEPEISTTTTTTTTTAVQNKKVKFTGESLNTVPIDVAPRLILLAVLMDPATGLTYPVESAADSE